MPRGTLVHLQPSPFPLERQDPTFAARNAGSPPAIPVSTRTPRPLRQTTGSIRARAPRSPRDSPLELFEFRYLTSSMAPVLQTPRMVWPVPCGRRPTSHRDEPSMTAASGTPPKRTRTPHVGPSAEHSSPQETNHPLVPSTHIPPTRNQPPVGPFDAYPSPQETSHPSVLPRHTPKKQGLHASVPPPNIPPHKKPATRWSVRDTSPPEDQRLRGSLLRAFLPEKPTTRLVLPRQIPRHKKPATRWSVRDTSNKKHGPFGKRGSRRPYIKRLVGRPASEFQPGGAAADETGKVVAGLS